MKIKGVIFDFNGTLVFDTHLHNQAWDFFLTKHSQKLSETEKNRKIHGKNNVEILSELFQNELTADEVAGLSKDKENIYQSLFLKEKLGLAPGAEDFIKFLLLNEISDTIATASDLYNLEFYFHHLRLERYFEKSKVVFSEGTIKSKPNPEIFLKAMDILKINKDQTLIFEDSIAGIVAAENSEAKKIVVVKSISNELIQQRHEVIEDFTQVNRSLFR
ncbi:HAD family hydrolase [Aquimarina spongiae]|uniref:Haloacid dehalogenase superfamily, subfamily IA, variant 3 with third motif having DD or ED n=1 Tax=Aquimarina spongiae TaxID=570521 RepID=A0A1M6HEL3_9FLAO|nr:HAD family phosphatase [Aquimarina spongiae]SHJ20647.1 haloacid dehalogenase superfamily, subfamily IA, variant 3 with third motif having DD or ED [Aquimarina spongiae]